MRLYGIPALNLTRLRGLQCRLPLSALSTAHYPGGLCDKKRRLADGGPWDCWVRADFLPVGSGQFAGMGWGTLGG
jgi:hypothetical protein